MKRLLLICIIEICVSLLIDAGAQTIHCVNRPNDGEVTIYFKNPAYKIRDTVFPQIYNQAETFSWIKVNDEEFGIIDSVGMPSLPQITFNINLPTNAENIRIYLVDSISNFVRTIRPMMPYQSDFSSADTHATYFPFIYFKPKEAFPSQRCKLSNIFRVRDKLGVSVTLFPYKYLPSTSELIILEGMELVIRYDLPRTRIEAPKSAVFEDYFESFFKNYTSTNIDMLPPRYLIVTSKKFYSDLQPFVDYKSSIGFDVDRIFIEEENMSSEGVQSVIQAMYDNEETRPDFILLVGDSANLPPACEDLMGVNCGNIVTDFPYVLLEGDDWEADAFIGRWPVSTVQELHNIISKTMYMEMNMQKLSKRALFVAGDHDEWWLVDYIMTRTFEVGHEYAIDNTFEPEGYSCEQRDQPRLQTVRNWMAWNPLVFAYSGHGSETTMGILNKDDEENSRIRGNTISEFCNRTFPMVFSFACKTGNYAFCDAVNIAESWIRSEKGGVLFFGSSANTINLADIVLEKKIFGEAFFDANKRSIGKILALAKRRFREHSICTSLTTFRYMNAYNLMGDPSFLVRGLSCPPQYTINGTNIVEGDDKEYYAAERIVIGNGVSLGNECTMLLSAGKEIVIEDGFETTGSAEVDAWIEGCNGVYREMTDVLPIVVDDDGANKFAQKDDSNPSSFSLFPNPTNDDVTMKFRADNISNAKMVIYNMQGIEVYEKNIPITTIGTQSINIPLSNIIPSGNYIVNLSVDDQVYKKIIIIQ